MLQRKDWWDEIDVKQKDAIDKGLKQLDNGLGVPHEEVMRNISNRYKMISPASPKSKKNFKVFSGVFVYSLSIISLTFSSKTF